MKFEELKEMGLNANYLIEKGKTITTISGKTEYGRFAVIKISEVAENAFSAEMSFCGFCDFVVLEAVMEYVKTPVEKRQEERKYYLRHRFLCGFEKCVFLNVDELNKRLYLSDKIQSSDVQTEFTQKEIDEIKEKYNTDLKDFEIIEVE